MKYIYGIIFIILCCVFSCQQKAIGDAPHKVKVQTVQSNATDIAFIIQINNRSTYLLNANGGILLLNPE